MRRGSARRTEQGTNARIAQVQSAPEQRGDVDREERVREERVVEAELGRDRAAEVAGPQDGAEWSGARDDVQDQAHESDRTDDRQVMRLVPEFRGALHGLL